MMAKGGGAFLFVLALFVDGKAEGFNSSSRISRGCRKTPLESSREIREDDSGGSDEMMMQHVPMDSADPSSLSSQLSDFCKGLRRLSILRPDVPNADFSAPLMMISAGGSSYTRLWTPETWKQHTLSYPHTRYFRHLRRWRYSTTAHKVFPVTLIAAGWALVVSCIVRVCPGSILIKASKGTSAALTSLSVPLALLLTLRTNAALARLNETRAAWGRLVLYARSYAALLRSYVLPLYPEAALLAAKHVAIYGWLLKSQLRGEDRSKELEVMNAVLGRDSADYQWLASHPRPVWAIPIRLRQITAAVASKRPRDYLVAHTLLEEGITNMEGVAGVCERILASPIPPTYSRHLSRVLAIWLAAFPIGLIGSGVPIIGVVVASAFTSYVLCGLDEIGMEVEFPFSLLPLQQLAAAVQSGVGMQLLDNECSDGPLPPPLLGDIPAVPF